jgi:hypothetical protein
LFRLVSESHDGIAVPVSDIDTAAVDSMKVLDRKRPIREVGPISTFSGDELL